MQKYYFVPGQYCLHERSFQTQKHHCSNSIIFSLENLGKERNNFNHLIHGCI